MMQGVVEALRAHSASTAQRKRAFANRLPHLDEEEVELVEWQRTAGSIRKPVHSRIRVVQVSRFQRGRLLGCSGWA
jgi:hypothetical protein